MNKLYDLAPSPIGGDYSDIKGTGYVERYNILRCPNAFYRRNVLDYFGTIIIVKNNRKKGFYLINLAIRPKIALPGGTRVANVGSSNRLKYNRTPPVSEALAVIDER